MAFLLNEEETLLHETAVDFFRDKMPVAHFRKLRDAKDETCFDPALWKEMAELGLAGILIDEAYGGTGFGAAGAGIVLQQAGRHLAPSPFLSTAVIAAYALGQGDDAVKQTYLPDIAKGEKIWAVAVDEGAHHAPDKISTEAKQKGEGWVLSGGKTFIPDGMAADYFLVAARAGAGVGLFIVSAGAKGLTRTRMAMADSRNYAELALADVAAEAVLSLEGADILEAAMDLARAGMAAEMLGGAEEMFERTVEYLKERRQFGEIIGSFQSLKHRAAEMFCELELARSCVRHAFVMMANDYGVHVARAASHAKARLGDISRLITNEAVQMHGGMGMTDEADPGLYLKRARLQATIYGDARYHRERFATLDSF